MLATIYIALNLAGITALVGWSMGYARGNAAVAAQEHRNSAMSGSDMSRGQATPPGFPSFGVPAVVWVAGTVITGVAVFALLLWLFAFMLMRARRIYVYAPGIRTSGDMAKRAQQSTGPARLAWAVLIMLLLLSLVGSYQITLASVQREAADARRKAQDLERRMEMERQQWNRRSSPGRYPW
ncbi:MAG: hypothetical protein HY321_08660 [Armatimonadetes bacterium]|nr:hypothetical protein [Armatimonadota bacterium]